MQLYISSMQTLILEMVIHTYYKALHKAVLHLPVWGTTEEGNKATSTWRLIKFKKKESLQKLFFYS